MDYSPAATAIATGAALAACKYFSRFVNRLPGLGRGLRRQMGVESAGEMNSDDFAAHRTGLSPTDGPGADHRRAATPVTDPIPEPPHAAGVAHACIPYGVTARLAYAGQHAVRTADNVSRGVTGVTIQDLRVEMGGYAEADTLRTIEGPCALDGHGDTHGPPARDARPFCRLLNRDAGGVQHTTSQVRLPTVDREQPAANVDHELRGQEPRSRRRTLNAGRWAQRCWRSVAGSAAATRALRDPTQSRAKVAQR